jgi:hypothetical protein
MRVHLFYVRYRNRDRSVLIAKKYLWVMLAATFIGISAVDSYLKTESARYGIVSLELCDLNSSCLKILGEWDAARRQKAAFSLGFDYLFILMYTAGILSVLATVKERLGLSLIPITNLAVSAVLIAAVCDAIENVLLLKFLETESIATYAVPAGYFAALKFALLASAAIWAVIGLIQSQRTKRDA